MSNVDKESHGTVKSSVKHSASLSTKDLLLNISYMLAFWGILSGPGIFNPVLQVFCVFSISCTIFVVSSLMREYSKDCSHNFASPYFFLTFKFFLYAFFLAKQIVIATLKTMKLIISHDDVEPVYSVIKVDKNTSYIVENSITATSGTIAIESKNGEVLVSAINEAVMEDLKLMIFTNKVELLVNKS